MAMIALNIVPMFDGYDKPSIEYHSLLIMINSLDWVLELDGYDTPLIWCQ